MVPKIGCSDRRRSRATLLVVALAACGSDGAGTATTGAGGATTSAIGGERELTVSAASSLKNAFTEIGTAFDAANDSDTTFNFDGSGTLQRQIEAGAPVDVFASAATKQMTALVDQDLVDPESVQVFAGNEIVLVVPAESKLAMSTFEDLTTADVKKITYGDPKAAPARGRRRGDPQHAGYLRAGQAQGRLRAQRLPGAGVRLDRRGRRRHHLRDARPRPEATR